MSEAVPTAGLLVIGDEILSGRTKDRNIGIVADFLAPLGIDLEEVRIVVDEFNQEALRFSEHLGYETGRRTL